MEKRVKSLIITIAIMAVLFYALPLFYETFNYYPPMKEDAPHRRTVLIWNIFTNQRVTFDTENPSIPVKQLPLYQGKSSLNTLNVSFINFSEAYNTYNYYNYSEEILFLTVNDEIAETRFNLTENDVDLKPIKIANFETTGFNNPDEYIIQQIRVRNFITQEGNLPMFSLGRVKITDVKLVYFNGFDTYPYRYGGQTTYYPAWKVTVETSNYGDEVLMVKAR
jgi:hypothetical protein